MAEKSRNINLYILPVFGISKNHPVYPRLAAYNLLGGVFKKEFRCLECWQLFPALPLMLGKDLRTIREPYGISR